MGDRRWGSLGSVALGALALGLLLPGTGQSHVAASTTSTGQPAPPAASDDTPTGRHRIDGRVDDWAGTPTGLSGTSQYSRGEFVYQDYLFDDLGADTRERAAQHGTFQPPAGDYRYPSDEDRFGFNSADIQELRLALDGHDLAVLVRFSTLKVPDGTVVAIGIDTDDDVSTGGRPWPDDSGLTVAGVDDVIELWGTGGTLSSPVADRPIALPEVAVQVQDSDNAIEARVPHELLDIASAPTIKVYAASGVWDPAAHAWMAPAPGDPTATAPGGGSPLVAARAFNAAFRADETGSYMEEIQAAALASGDISAFSASVEPHALLANEHRPYSLARGRFYAAVLDTGFSVPPYTEGVGYKGVVGRFQGVGGAALQQTFQFYGRYQPYGLYVPSTYDGRTATPAMLVLHGIGGSYSGYQSSVGFLRDIGEGAGVAGQPPMVLISPLARGSSFYADWGEADTLAVLRDAFSRVPVDHNRLYLGGYSMGGYGVYRLAVEYPDLFAAAVVWAGYSGEFTGNYLTDPNELTGDPTGLGAKISTALQPVVGAAGAGDGRRGKANIGDPVDALENLRYVPLLESGGTNDEIVPTPGQYAAPRRLAALGYRSRFDLYPGYEHLSFAIVDDWKEARAYLGDRTRTATPRVVNYVFSDGWTAPGLAAQLGLVHDGAWWLRGLTMRDPTDDGLTLAAATATATSHGVAEPTVSVTTTRDAAAAPTPHLRLATDWEAGAPAALGNRLDLVLTGVGAATVDLAAAMLDPCRLVLHVVTDGPVTVRLGGFVVAIPGPGDTTQELPCA